LAFKCIAGAPSYFGGRNHTTKKQKQNRLGYKLAKLSGAGIQVHRDVDVHLAILAGEIKMAGEDSRPYFDLVFEVRLE
jgi:hypothetical protein